MFFLALRQLLSRKKQTILTILGILLGTLAYIIISSMLLGFREFLIDQLLNNDAHIRITARQDELTEHSLDQAFYPQKLVHWLTPPSGFKNSPRIQNPQGWYQRLKADPRVVAFSPQLNTQILMTRSGISVSARMIGSNPDQQLQVTTLGTYMTEGQFTDIGSGSNRLVAGTALLQKLGARVGETVWISSGKKAPLPFKIVGAFQVGIRTLDETTVFGSLSDAQALNNTPSDITDIAIRIKEVSQAKSMAQTYRQLDSEQVQSWDEVNANFLAVFKIQDSVRYMMTVSILIVAGFSIYNILNMVVNQKRKEIAILRSIGFEPKDIIKLFLIQGLILGLIGGLLGLGFGWIASFLLSKVPFPGSPLTSGGTLMMSFTPSIYIIGFILSISSSLLASWLPARAAGKLSPIDIIRSEG